MQFENLTYKIIGAAMRVHARLGPGFQEVIYQRALESELQKARIIFVREFEMPVYYHGQQVGERRVDFLIEEKISVEIKAISQLGKLQLAQAVNYLEAYNLSTGLLLNFGSEDLEFKRLINNKFYHEMGTSLVKGVSGPRSKGSEGYEGSQGVSEPRI